MYKFKLLLSICLIIGCITTRGEYKSNTSFNYDNIKWKQYKNSSDRIKALQIPNNILKSLPTNELVAICLDFPYLPDILFFDNVDKGFETTTKKFNGFTELFNRKGIMDVLLSIDEHFFEKSKDSITSSTIELGNYILQSLFIELILVQDKYISELTEKQKEKLYKTYLYNSEYRVRIGNLGKKIEKHIEQKLKSIQSDSIQDLLRESPYVLVDSITTPKGSIVPSAYKFVYQDMAINSWDYSYRVNYINNNYPNVIIVGPPSYKYNCHGYAWHVSEGGDEVWIGDSDGAESIYWNDDSYIEVPLNIATKVSYGTADHSAIVYDSSRFKSKWGDFPLVIHYPNDTPYDSTAIKKYYIKNTMRFSGHKVVCGSETYAVKGLPVGASVAWDFVQASGDDEAIITPLGVNGDSCLVYGRYSSYELFEGLLYARVYLAGTLIKTYTQYIYEDGDFIGFYWDGTPYDDVYENYMTEDDNWITQGSMMLVRSDNLRGKSINIYRNSEYMPIVSGGTTNGTSDFLYEVLGFAPGDTLRMQVYGDGSCTTDEFMFYVQSPSRSQNNRRTLQIQLMGENQYKFHVSGTEKSNEFSAISTSDEVRKYYVYNASSLRLVSTDTYTGTEFIVDASSWPTGTYIVFTKIKGKTYSAKFVRK